MHPSDPDNLANYELNNGVVGMPVTIPLYESFDEGLAQLKIYLRQMRQSTFIYGLYACSYTFFASFPTQLLELVVHQISLHFSGFFTNFYGSSQICIYDGKKQLACFAIAEPVAKTTFSISLCTIGK